MDIKWNILQKPICGNVNDAELEVGGLCVETIEETMCPPVLYNGTVSISDPQWRLDTDKHVLQNQGPPSLFRLVLRNIAGVTHFCPCRRRTALVSCALEQDVFFCAVSWNDTLFLYPLVFHPTTTPDSQRFAGYGYFYWKTRNVSKLLFSLSLSLLRFSLFFHLSIHPSLSLCLFLFFRDKGSKLFGIRNMVASLPVCVKCPPFGRANVLPMSMKLLSWTLVGEAGLSIKTNYSDCEMNQQFSTSHRDY